MALLGVQDLKSMHWISRGFRISDWISDVFHVDFWISGFQSGFLHNFHSGFGFLGGAWS